MQFNVFTEKELTTLRYALGNINHENGVIEQNYNNPEAIRECVENIDCYISEAFKVLEEKAGEPHDR
jgi:hypothetical protein